MGSKNDVELFAAPEKRYKELIVFIHHFGGSKKSTLRHVRAVNELGFDALSFSQPFHFTKLQGSDFVKTSAAALLSTKGLPELWKTEITKYLMPYQQREIIFYSFSSPSLTVPWIVSENNFQITGWVCDGGPFLDFTKSFYNYMTKYQQINNPIIWGPLLASTLFSWNGWSIVSTVHRQLRQFPDQFPVLSFRALNDLLVAPESIHKLFSPHQQLDVHSIELENVGHLNGLMLAKDLYLKHLDNFLKRIGSAEV